MTDSYGAPLPAPKTSSEREVRFEHSADLAQTLADAKISILISTYQAGKVASLGVVNDQIDLQLHNYDHRWGSP